jgi:hypothetical protein
MDARFNELCRELCDLAGVPLLEVQTDEHGSQVGSLILRDVEVQVLQSPDSRDRVFSRVVIGPAPSDSDALWGELLAANYLFFMAGEGSFSRDPWTGDVILQQRWSAEISARELLERLTRHCDISRDDLVSRLSDEGTKR